MAVAVVLRLMKGWAETVLFDTRRDSKSDKDACAQSASGIQIALSRGVSGLVKYPAKPVAVQK